MTARPRLLPPDFFDFCGIGAINETAKKIGKLYAKSAQLKSDLLKKPPPQRVMSGATCPKMDLCASYIEG